FSAVLLSSAIASCAALANGAYPLTRACETALALSASPTYVRSGAGAYVLGEKEYELVRPSTNGYVCLVQRNSNESLIPKCFDQIGQRAHVPVHKQAGKMLRQGNSWEEIDEAREKGFKSGDFQTADGHGVVYMASDFNYIVSTDGQSRRKIWPHVMYHAPNVTNADIASSPRDAFANKGLPFIAGEGPLGYMISLIERPTDSSDVLTACVGQLPDVSTFSPFPPAGN
ncbi:MAG: hypothetical protein AAFW68_14005, partial [Pseudomonadota bacterium]